MNKVAKAIRESRISFENIVNDFRAYWGKVYRGEVTEALNKAIQAGDKANRYALEQVCAKIKGLTLREDTKALIKSMHDEDKLTFSCLREEYIVNGLNGLGFVGVGEDGKPVLCELRKKDKEATEKTWEPVAKWTEAKVGRYFRLATVRINEQSK